MQLHLLSRPNPYPDTPKPKQKDFDVLFLRSLTSFPNIDRLNSTVKVVAVDETVVVVVFAVACCCLLLLVVACVSCLSSIFDFEMHSIATRNQRTVCSRVKNAPKKLCWYLNKAYISSKRNL